MNKQDLQFMLTQMALMEAAVRSEAWVILMSEELPWWRRWLFRRADRKMRNELIRDKVKELREKRRLAEERREALNEAVEGLGSVVVFKPSGDGSSQPN